jgi:hypothetical protein
MQPWNVHEHCGSISGMSTDARLDLHARDRPGGPGRGARPVPALPPAAPARRTRAAPAAENRTAPAEGIRDAPEVPR